MDVDDPTAVIAATIGLCVLGGLLVLWLFAFEIASARNGASRKVSRSF